MVLEKTLTYVRYSLVVVLVLYLGIVWLYFKDNATELTLGSFVLWFLLLPLLLLSAMAVMRWYQNKPATDDSATPAAPSASTTPKTLPKSQRLLISGQVLLPEGNEWSQIIDNNEDLTTLEPTITDAFNLPILTKPVRDIEEEMASDISDSTDEDASSVDSFTQRVWALLQTQLSAHEKALSAISEHSLTHIAERTAGDTASDIHPEWQHTPTLHMQQEDMPDTAPAPTVSEFELYVHVPADADSNFIHSSLQALMADYGITDALLSLRMVKDNDPLFFISDVMHGIAHSAKPRIGMLVMADTQIDQDWLDNHADIDIETSSIPTEAASALLFANPAAGEILALDTLVPVQLSATIDLSLPDSPNDAQTRPYKQLLPQVKGQLFEQKILPSTVEDTEQKESDISEHPLLIVSDLDLVHQSDALEAFMKFSDALEQQHISVDAHHLGYMMPANPWLTSFIPICLLTQYANEHIGTEDILLSVIQHPTCCSLWHVSTP